jgi:hypothetical protein
MGRMIKRVHGNLICKCGGKVKRIDLGSYTFRQYKCGKCHKTTTIDRS